MKYLGVEPALRVANDLRQLDVPERVPQLRVGGPVQGVQVVAQRAAKEGGLLGDERHRGAHVVQTHLQHVRVVNENLALGHVRQPHQGDHDGGLARTRAPANAYLRKEMEARQINITSLSPSPAVSGFISTKLNRQTLVASWLGACNCAK